MIDGLVDKYDEENIDINMTPMIDVVFTIIAFMMILINSPMRVLDMDLPKVEEAALVQADAQKSIQLSVVQDSKIWKINDGPNLGRAEVLAKLTDLKSVADNPLSIVVSIDKNAPVQRMIDTLDILQTSKISNVKILLSSEKSAHMTP